MPGGSLRDVNQKFSADASAYVAEMGSIIASNREVVRSLQEVTRQNEEMVRALGGGDDIGAVNRAIRENLQTIREYGPVIAEAAARNREFNSAQAETVRLSKEGRSALQDLGEAYGLVGERATASQKDIAAGFIGQMSHLDQMVIKLGVAKEAYGALGDASKPLAYTARDMNALNDSLASVRVNADGVVRALSETEQVKARILGSGGYGSQGGDIWGPAVYSPFGVGGGGIVPPVAQPFFNDGGGGGGGAAAGAFFGALRPSNIFGGATATLAAAHMATMLTMEIASQVIPAVVAAGAAAAVGYQGGTAAYQRGSGIYAAGEALGGAYGQTPGNLFGMGAGYQVAQNQATGGVYGIIGNLMRMAGGGTGQNQILGPGGMGVQTVAMIDRGLANMVSNGRMSQLSAALGGGTGALRTIGDIGANIGDTLLNLAPNLPGMGGILFGGLKGITGAASYATGHIPGPLLGAGLAAEAGYRWGGPILGGGKLPWFLGGRQFGGIAGLAERMGLGTVADAGAGVEGAGLAGFLGGGAAGPIGLAAALSAFTMSQLAGTMPTSQMRQIAGLQAGISSSFGAGTLDPITKALYQAGQMTTGAPATGLAASMAQNIPAMETSSQIARFGPQGGMGAPPAAVISNAVSSFATQLGQMTASGPAAQKALDGLGVKGATLAQAMDYMTMAMISPKDVGPGGVLDKTAMSQLAGFVKTYSLMKSGGQTSASAILSASSADYVMATPQMKSLSQINSALDSMTQIMTGGPANASALFQATAAAPAGMARALGQGPFTTAGAAAWQAFTNPQTGIMAASQANMDQLRTFMTIGGLSGAQAGQLGAFELKQYAPLASQSPMALAMLQQQAMQAGVPGVAMGQDYAQTQKALSAHAGTMKQANQLLTQGTQAAANIPGVADFLNPQANISPLQSALYAQMAQSALTAVKSPTGANVAALQSSLSMSGVKPGQMQVGVDAILKNLHVPGNLTAEINGKLKVPSVPAVKGAVNFDNFLKPVHVPAAKGAVNFDNFLKPVPTQHATGIVSYTNQFAHATPPVLHGIAIYSVQMAGVVGGGPGMRLVGGQTGFKVPGYGGGDIWGPAMLEPGELVVPKNMVAGGAVDHLRGSIPGFAAGGLAGVDVPFVTGVSTAFRIAMQETVDDLLNALGGVLGQVTSGIRSGGSGGGVMRPLTGGPPPAGTGNSPVPVHVASVANAAAAAIGGGLGGTVPGGGLPLDAKAQKVIDAFEKTFAGMGSPFGQFASQLLTGELGNLKDPMKETAAAAQKLVNQVSTEVNYARGAAGAFASGQGYTPAGQSAGLLSTFGSFATPTTTAQGQNYQYYTDQQAVAGGGTLSVQQQMSDYLQAEKSFGGDLAKLTKGGLNKKLLQQLVSAGPLQGDQMAQSILGGQGGIGSANQLYKQIQQQSNQLGIGSAQDIYGPVKQMSGKTVAVKATADAGPVHALQAAINQLHGKTVTVTVNLVESGGGSGGKMSPAQAKQATAQVQKGLLQQAKNNRVTGVKLPPPYST